ncbi:hypothetical protein AB0J38_19645 [Streptomyces sp. NPDC050095]|uniref:hypothetical protein n=1 Tax=unclassified Streptomyces TaxID=2593676 RepID=UPI00342BA307
MNDELHQRLREAADAHRPDRERMLARIERGMQEDPALRPEPRRPAVGWVRIAAVTAGVAGVLAAGGFAVGAALRDDGAPQQQVAVSPTPTPSPGATSRSPKPSDPSAPSASSSAAGGASAPAHTPRHSPSGPAKPSASGKAAPPAAPSATATTDGPLWSDGSVDPGSNDYWAQSNVTFKTQQSLSALTVELRVAQTGGVTNTGSWRSRPADDFTVSVTERDGFLIYRWTLKPGRTVPSGEFVFAGQYDHATGGRDAGGDTYTVTGRTAHGEQATVGGDFA